VGVEFGNWQKVQDQEIWNAQGPDGVSAREVVGIRDLDGDGWADVVVSFQLSTFPNPRRLAVAWGASDGQCVFEWIGDPPVSTDIVEAADFDGDGDLDVVVGPDLEGRFRMLANDGAGHFSGRRFLDE